MYRKATINDCEKVYDLICELECKKLPYDRFSAIYEKQISNERYYCLLCEQDGHIAGLLNLRFEEQLHHSECIAEIMEFIVASSYRKCGIGKEMLARACQIAETFHCTQIELATNQLRTDAHRFYTREGMHNFHFKFSKSLYETDTAVNQIPRCMQRGI